MYYWPPQHERILQDRSIWPPLLPLKLVNKKKKLSELRDKDRAECAVTSKRGRKLTVAEKRRYLQHLAIIIPKYYYLCVFIIIIITLSLLNNSMYIIIVFVGSCG